MSYVDAIFNKETDQIQIVERDKDGNRRFIDHPARYVLYYQDPRGKFRSIYGEQLARVSTNQQKDFFKEQKILMNKGHQIYESDINPIYRCLEENYLGRDAPDLNVCFFDIEVDFDPETGYSTPENPFNPITSISLYLSWTQQMITLAVPPKNLEQFAARDITKNLDNVYIFTKEKDMLDTFLSLIEDADILTGWNSEGYDIPYIINRVTTVLSKDDTRRFCLWDQFPKQRKYEKFGREIETYDLVGRIHLDYLELYRKYNYEERHSYRLDYIGEQEIGEKKTVYEGSLDQLYNNDFKRFIEYNRQDVQIMVSLDAKLKFIDLTNELAHANTVLLPTTMGAVAVTEQAIINEAHRRGLIVPNRPRRDTEESTSAAGAYVAYPKKGLHDWIGSVDLTSLYPSVIRALNMGPETLVGQLRQSDTQKMIHRAIADKKSFANAWEGKFGTLEYEAVMAKDKSRTITIDWRDGQNTVMSAAEVYELVFNSQNPWMLSANGTIFTYEFEAVIPGLLKRWFEERKDMQQKMRESGDNDIERAFWAKRQLVKKINLNSLYGAILNPGCRFFDLRIGQSVTLTGRQISKHMASKVNEIITGEYDHRGESIIYGDTDSVYFSAYKSLEEDIKQGTVPWSKESIVKLYDKVAEETNHSFPQFMYQAFHCPKSRGQVIKAGREAVASKGLFITKKRYAILMYDLEGNRMDSESAGKVKAMGLDLKRSDTPEFIQDFLSDVLLMILTGRSEEEVLEFISDFRYEFRKRPGWEKGTPKRVNNLTEYAGKEKRMGKANMPGHVRAAMNWNKCLEMFDDKHSMKITDGAKTIVCKLKNNPMQYTSVGYPIDERHLPKWFTDLPFDHQAMEETVITNKIENLMAVLNWNIQNTEETNTFNQLFDIE
jgi:DNA polymerase elongation subunit (family B)